MGLSSCVLKVECKTKNRVKRKHPSVGSPLKEKNRVESKRKTATVESFGG